MKKDIFRAALLGLLAVCMLRSAQAAYFQVSNATELQNALTTAASNGEDDFIYVAQGTYSGTFGYSSNEGYDITLLGGYLPNFSDRILDPANTILDGSAGSGAVLSLSSEEGSIFIQGFKVLGNTNGACISAQTQTLVAMGPVGDISIGYNIVTGGQSVFGGGIYAISAAVNSTSGFITIYNNFVQNNSGEIGGGVFLATVDGGAVLMYNNVITGNTATSYGAGLNCDGQSLYLYNNTIVGNTAPAAAGAGIHCSVRTGSVYELINNIIRGNTSIDIFFADFGGGAKNGNNNDYSTLTGTWTASSANIDKDPVFVGSSDYHLAAGSPCIDAGKNDASYFLPTYDFDGHGRILNGSFLTEGYADIGADEFLPQVPVCHGSDFTGNAKSDVTVWKPSNGRWYIKGGTWPFWGGSGDICAPGDFDGNNITDVAVFKPSNGRWYIKGQSWPFWGAQGDLPVPGDYNGDGTSDIAVWRPANGRWYIQGQTWPIFGASGDFPAPGDYNGDGTTEVAVWRPSEGKWYIQGMGTVTLGQVNDIPIPGDYDGDGADEAAVWRPSDGKWYIDGMAAQSWGQYGDIPVPGDFDGNGVTDIAVFRPANGRWYIKDQTWPFWGDSGDMPIKR